MTGPDHYTEAERLIEAAGEIPSHHDDTNPGAVVLLAEAQAHATLALAAAVALGGHLADPQFRKPIYPHETEAWERVAGSAGPRGASFSCGPGFPPLLRNLPRMGVTRFELMEGDRYE